MKFKIDKFYKCDDHRIYYAHGCFKAHSHGFTGEGKSPKKAIKDWLKKADERITKTGKALVVLDYRYLNSAIDFVEIEYTTEEQEKVLKNAAGKSEEQSIDALKISYSLMSMEESEAYNDIGEMQKDCQSDLLYQQIKNEGWIGIWKESKVLNKKEAIKNLEEYDFLVYIINGE